MLKMCEPKYKKGCREKKGNKGEQKGKKGKKRKKERKQVKMYEYEYSTGPVIQLLAQYLE